MILALPLPIILQAYPLDLVRTRLAAQTGGPIYQGISHAFATIVHTDGPAGLYRGLAATLLQVVPSLALNFAIYESSRQWAMGGSAERGRGPPSALVSMACGCTAGFATSTITFPLDVVRRRMQMAGRAAAAPSASTSGTASAGSGAPAPQHAAVTYGSVIRGVVAGQGLRGFYVGIIPEYCKVLPGVAIAFMTYEKMKHWLGADVPA